MLTKMRGLAFIFILAQLTVTHAEAQQSYTAKDLFFTAFADGFVDVDYLASVDPTLDRVNMTLFGIQYEYLIVVDQDGLPLDYSQSTGSITVYTLGSSMVSISYSTPDLTNKTAGTWTFSASAPITASVLLPANSTVVEMNTVPSSIGSLEGKTFLLMPAGFIKVSYTIGIEGTRENALTLIKDAELAIGTIKARDVIVSEAESKLQQAYMAFNSRNYIQAEQLATQAKITALESSAAASAAQTAINKAESEVSKARTEGRTAGLDSAESLLQEARGSYNSGKYVEAKNLASQAEASASKATAPAPATIWIIAIALGAAVVVLAIIFIRGRRKLVRGSDEQGGAVNLSIIFDHKPNLRLEDKEVLRFLAGSNGEAFASEIRDRFDMPRTSAWRMIRRLQKEDLVDVKSVGGQSLVRIKTRYRLAGDGL